MGARSFPFSLFSFFSINMGQWRWPPVDFTLSPSLEARKTSSNRRRCLTSARTTTRESTIKFCYSILFRRRKGPFRSVGLVDKYFYTPKNYKFPSVCVCVCELNLSFVRFVSHNGGLPSPLAFLLWGISVEIKVLYLVVYFIRAHTLSACV